MNDLRPKPDLIAPQLTISVLKPSIDSPLVVSFDPHLPHLPNQQNQLKPDSILRLINLDPNQALRPFNFKNRHNNTNTIAVKSGTPISVKAQDCWPQNTVFPLDCIGKLIKPPKDNSNNHNKASDPTGEIVISEVPDGEG